MQKTDSSLRFTTNVPKILTFKTEHSEQTQPTGNFLGFKTKRKFFLRLNT